MDLEQWREQLNLLMMKREIKTFLIFCCFFIISICCYSQIYDGSNGDGFSVRSKNATTLDNISLTVLYEGSNGDGFDVESRAATTLNNTSLTVLYEGSNGDGFDVESRVATTLNNTSLTVLYEGSNGDGFSNRLLTSTTLDNTSLAVLYDGSNGDGFSNRLLAATTLDNTSLVVLYEGSNGDGFSRRQLSAITLDNTSLAILYDGSNGDGFDLSQFTGFLDPNAPVDLFLSMKVFLEGSYGSGSLLDDLRMDNLLPTTSPYADGRTCDSSVFNTSDNNAIIDWVWVEFREADGTTVAFETSALLQADGDVVDTDGISPLTVSLTTGSYRIMVAHRNHIGVLTSNAYNMVSGNQTNIDITSNETQITGGLNGIADMGDGNIALFAGDYNGDGQIQNTDRSNVEARRGNSGYTDADLDMNGQVQNSDIQNLLNPNLGKGQQFTSRIINLKLYAKRANQE